MTKMTFSAPKKKVIPKEAPIEKTLKRGARNVIFVIFCPSL